MAVRARTAYDLVRDLVGEAVVRKPPSALAPLPFAAGADSSSTVPLSPVVKGAAIVYVHKRDMADSLAARLSASGFRAAAYRFDATDPMVRLTFAASTQLLTL